MSGVRQGIRRALLGPAGSWWHLLVTVPLVLLSVPVFAALALAIRLWAGPIDVTEPARRLLATHGGGAVQVERVRLAWNGWREGPRAPLDLLLDDVRFGPSRIGHGSAALDFVALLRGRPSLLSLRIDDGAILLRRDRAGGVGLQGSGQDGSGKPPRPAVQDGAGANGLDLDHLREVAILHSTAALADAASGLSCRADIADLRIDPLHRPAAIGLSGGFEAGLSCGGPGIDLHGAGREGPGGDIVWNLATGSVVPAALARVIPLLGPLAALDLPVTMTMQAALSGGFGRIMLPREIALTAILGAGTVTIPGGVAGDPGLAVRQGAIHLSVSLPDRPGGATAVVLSDTSLTLAEPGAPTFQLSGAGSLAGPAPERWKVGATLDARVAQFDFANLSRIWPSSLAAGGRRWVTENITAGAGRNLVAHVVLTSAAGADGLHLAGLSGGLDASGLTLSWLRPITPLRGMDARLVLEGPNSLRIESRHAIQDVPGHGEIGVGPTTMRITGLNERRQVGQIDTHLHGALADVLALLANPRLRLLSRHPLPFTDPSGVADARLGVSLPLINAVKIDDVAIRADTTLTGVHLGGVVAGRDFDAGDLVVNASNDGLAVHGNGMLAGVPAALKYGMDFRGGGPREVTEQAHVSAPISAAVLRREGLDSAHRMSGLVLADVTYEHRRSGAATVALQLDLTPAAFDAPGWRKLAGAGANASGTVGLQDGHLVSIEALHAQGPDLSLDGHALIVQGQPQALTLDRFALGRSRGSGRIDLPAAATRRPLHIALQGPVLDLVPFLAGGLSGDQASGGKAADAKESGGKKEASWSADLDFRKVWISADRGFAAVTLHAEAAGTRIANARLAIAEPTPVSATVTPQTGGRRLRVSVQDSGALLSAFGVGERIEGGVLSLRGRLDDQPPGAGASKAGMLTGLATIGPFTVQDAPLAARIARDLSLYGFVTGAASKQLAVTRVEIPFTLQGSTLRLTGAHAYNAALGVTLRGPIDLGQEMLDLRGTLVPSYLFNALPGKLPGLGQVFSPEKGGGLLAVTLRITGPLDKPVVAANPLALLAPGILRRLLFN